MALELLEQFSEIWSDSESAIGSAQLDAIVVPVSGCGMISGIAIAAKTQYPDLKIIAAEPSGANNCPDVVMSLAAGELIGPASSGTVLTPIACVYTGDFARLVHDFATDYLSLSIGGSMAQWPNHDMRRIARPHERSDMVSGQGMGRWCRSS